MEMPMPCRSLLLALLVSSLVAADVETSVPKGGAWVSPADTAGLATVRLHFPSTWHQSQPASDREIDPAPPRVTIGEKQIPLLHVVWRELPAENAPIMECLARIRADTIPVGANISAQTTSGWSYGILSDCEVLAQDTTLDADWRGAFLALLRQRIATHEDHEIETLLVLRLTGSLPEESFPTWKRDDVVRLLAGLNGFNDIADALPDAQRIHLGPEVADQQSPDPLFLPKVDAPNAPANSGSAVARFVPRSCWCIEWSDPTTALTTIRAVAGFVDEWTGAAWPVSCLDLVERICDDLGLDEALLADLAGKDIDGVALFGWDWYLQSGSNVGFIIHAKQPIGLPGNFSGKHPGAVALDDHTILLSTGGRIADMAKRAIADGTSLESDPCYRQDRAACTVADGERELGFAFLGDHWLTNLISPRWFVQTERRRNVNARIRLVTLLRAVVAAERGLDTPAPLASLRSGSGLPDGDIAWLLDGLAERDGVLVHRDLGGLWAHPPIDELPFDRVTAREAQAYEDFCTLYRNRWERADPLAFHAVREADGQLRTSLLISPISRRSDFAMVDQFLSPTKLPHRVVVMPGAAAGLSLTLRTEAATPMIGLRLPQVLNLQASALDFAWTSFRPNQWLKESPEEDEVSYLRLPAAIIVPNVLLDGLLGGGLLGARNWTPTDEQGIQAMDAGSGAYPCLRWRAEGEGFSALAAHPGPLRALRDVPVTYRDTPACDLYAWFDGRAGYLLRRRLWQLAITDRSVADWRRSNRLRRINDYIGATKAPAAVVASFPRPGMPLSVGSGMPTYLEAGRGWGSVMRDLDDLPPIIAGLHAASLAISVGADSLRFDGRWRWDAEADPGNGIQAVPADADTEATTLDFDR